MNKNKTLLKICVSLILIFFILSRLNLEELIQNIRSISMRLYVLSLLLGFVEVLLRASRWKMLLEVKGIDISLKQSISFQLVGTFFGIFLPGNLGIDIAKIYDFSKHSSRPIDTISSVFMERWTGIMSLSLISIAVIFSSEINANRQVQGLIILFFVCLVVLSMLIFSQRLYKKMTTLILSDRKLFVLFKDRLELLIVSIQGYRKHKVLFMKTFVTAFIITLMRIGINFINSLAMGLDISFMYFILFIPVIMIIMLIPVSIAGIGVQEGAYLYFFSQIGMNANNAVLLSWMGFMLVIFHAIAGGIIFALRNNQQISTKVS